MIFRMLFKFHEVTVRENAVKRVRISTESAREAYAYLLMHPKWPFHLRSLQDNFRYGSTILYVLFFEHGFVQLASLLFAVCVSVLRFGKARSVIWQMPNIGTLSIETKRISFRFVNAQLRWFEPKEILFGVWIVSAPVNTSPNFVFCPIVEFLFQQSMSSFWVVTIKCSNICM
jgi:hypothetical protein